MNSPFKTFQHRLLARNTALFFVFALVFASAGSKLVGWKSLTPGRWLIALALVGMIYLCMDKSTFLPFLGETVLPPSVLRVSTPAESTIDVTVSAPRNATHVIYWAAAPSMTTIVNPTEAYAGFKNAGVVQVIGGRAVLALLCPSRYKVPMKGKALDKHVHYRFVYPDGILSDVKTEKLKC